MDDDLPTVRAIVRTRDGLRYVWRVTIGERVGVPEDVTILALEEPLGHWRWGDDEGRAAVEWLESEGDGPSEPLKGTPSNGRH